ncbi:hypothetical protein Tco_0729880 [Tanacetum coccineum]|uniref:Transmembrane protein n=1 Tax=Tanacetum coccineum TaxID=301880 RepID=A0ABQ4YQ49_9ASTR
MTFLSDVHVSSIYITSNTTTDFAVPLSDFAQTLNVFRSLEVQKQKKKSGGVVVVVLWFWCCGGAGAVVVVWCCCCGFAASVVVLLRWWSCGGGSLGVRPNRRLRPDAFEAKAEWWVSSREFFDGRIHEPPRIPSLVNLPSRYDVPKYIDRRFDETP